MQKVTPCLWFNNNAEEAVNFYTSIFPDSKTGHVARYSDAGPGPKDQVLTIEFTLAGLEFLALNGGPQFKFTEAISLIVNVKTQGELDQIWNQLLEGGQPQQCGWLKDKFGLSWQVVPTIVGEMMRDQDPEKAKRVMEAVLKMVKLDIQTLKDAYSGATVP